MLGALMSTDSWVSHSESERPFWVSKDVLDTLNSIFWFFTDALWMLGLPGIAMGAAIPTIFTGLCLLYVEKRKNVFFINLAINSWIIMNTLWMLSDAFKAPELMIYTRGAFFLGLVFIGFAVQFSPSLKETFSHFRRFRGFRG